jgi:hypothetical protein
VLPLWNCCSEFWLNALLVSLVCVVPPINAIPLSCRRVPGAAQQRR